MLRRSTGSRLAAASSRPIKASGADRWQAPKVYTPQTKNAARSGAAFDLPSLAMPPWQRERRALRGPGGRIRTCDPHNPIVVRYQTALRPESEADYPQATAAVNRRRHAAVQTDATGTEARLGARPPRPRPIRRQGAPSLPSSRVRERRLQPARRRRGSMPRRRRRCVSDRPRDAWVGAGRSLTAVRFIWRPLIARRGH